MDFDLRKPCACCPFKKSHGALLHKGRAEELGGMMLSAQGATFQCHLTLGKGKRAKHCAGALIFAVKNDNHTQMMRIAGRLGFFDPEALDKSSFDTVFDTIEEMLQAQR